MAELRVGATPRELIPGQPDEIEALAARMALLGNGFTAAANQLRAIEAGEWKGEAADAFRSVVGQEPDKYDQAGTAFRVAAGASRSFASVLRDAQTRAGQTIDLFESAEAATARWRDSVDRYESAQRRAESSGDEEEMARAAAMPSPGGDPGAGNRDQAHGMLASARDEVAAEGARAAAALEEQWQDAPNEPGLFDRIVGWGGEFVGGVWDSVWGTAEFLWSVSTVRMIIDPEGWRRDVTALGQGLWYGITHPVEFGKILLDWDTWRENPARALGRLVPDLLLTLATGGGAAAARGVRGASALRRLAGRADEVGDLATAANRAEDLADVSLVRRNLPELRGSIRDSFHNGEYRIIDLDEGTRVYRAENAGQGSGSFFGDVKPVNRNDAEEMYNLRLWDNRSEVVSTYEITEPVSVYYGRVAGGSGQQYLVPRDIPPAMRDEIFQHVETGFLPHHWMTPLPPVR
jgi:hypothetical protein